MATGVQIFTSGDSSAPQLFGSSGSLVSVLDACLVNGYGSISPAGTAGAGAWSKAFSGTSKAAYRPSAGNRLYLRVQDDGPGASTFQEARIVGYESMTTVDAGTNPMPTVAQFTNGIFVRKSATLDSITGRPWIVVADDRTLYMFIQSGDTANAYYAWMWGDIYSLLTADSYRTMIVGRVSENSGTSANERLDKCDLLNTNLVAGHFLQRTYAASGTAITAWKGGTIAPAVSSSGNLIGNITGPNAAGGGYITLPIYVGELTPVMRGVMRGLWYGGHTLASYNDGDVYSGTINGVARTFRVIKQTGNNAVYIVESSDTWNTSS